MVEQKRTEVCETSVRGELMISFAGAGAILASLIVERVFRAMNLLAECRSSPILFSLPIDLAALGRAAIDTADFVSFPVFHVFLRCH